MSFIISNFFSSLHNLTSPYISDCVANERVFNNLSEKICIIISYFSTLKDLVKASIEAINIAYYSYYHLLILLRFHHFLDYQFLYFQLRLLVQ
jgi:hypothetical protein